MRFPGVFLCLALIFCLHFESVFSQQDFTGTWSNPAKKDQTSDCCIPDEIVVEKTSTGGYTATYKYKGLVNILDTNGACVDLFLTSTDTTLDILRKDDGNYGAKSPRLFSKSELYTYKITGASLNIQFSSQYYSSYPKSKCNFTMQTYKSPPGHAGKALIFIAILAIIIVFIYKAHVKKQAQKIAQENSQPAQPSQPYPVGAGVPQTGYNPPVAYNQGGYPQASAQSYPQQGYGQPKPMPQGNVQIQAQGGYPQPQQMAMPQGNVNMNMNAGGYYPK